jgi:hypothetical protein
MAAPARQAPRSPLAAARTRVQTAAMPEGRIIAIACICR